MGSMTEKKMTEKANGPARRTYRAGEKRPDPEIAARARAEAEARRQEGNSGPALPKEINGRKGPEPIRFGDWEKDGIASDF
jgi:hypothetical protein